MNADDETEAVDDNKLAAVAFYETNAADLLARAGGEGESPFTVNLYDYSGTGQSPETINKYLASDEVDKKLRFGGGSSSTDGSDVYNKWNVSDSKYVNIYQGIPTDVDPDIVDVLFPDKSVPFRGQDAITVYKNVNVDEFLFYDKETKSYSYNSDESSAWYADGKLAQDPDAEVAGFWPFDNEGSVHRTNLEYPETGFFYTGSNWFFGRDLSFNFSKPEDGQFNNQDMIFSFGGDDDVGVFLFDLDHP